MPSVNHGDCQVFNRCAAVFLTQSSVLDAVFLTCGHRVHAPANPSYPAALPTLFLGVPTLAQLELPQSLELDLQPLALIDHAQLLDLHLHACMHRKPCPVVL